jgi:hypothetical protein
MRHSWLVLATLLVCAGEVDAKHVSCACPAVVTLPERGATDVPLNAKLWSFGSPGPHTFTASDGAVIPNVQVESVTLNANDTYKNADWMMDFTTSGDTDATAPAPPSLIYASVVTLADGSIEALSVSGQLPNDAALVRIDLRDATGAIARVMTTPSRLFLCQPELRVTPGKLTVEIRALDLAGNQSGPASTIIDTTPSWNRDPDLDCNASTGREHHYPRGHGFEILLFVLVVPAGLIAWLIIVIVRRVTVNRHLAEPISLLAAEEVARRLIRWQVVWSAMLVIATFAVMRGIDDQFWIFFAPWLFSSFGKLFLQQRALRLLDRPETDAVRRGPWLVVTSLRDSVTVRASDSDFVVAKRRAIPKSVVQ